MSNILSVYAGPHDAAISVIKDGKVLINLEKDTMAAFMNNYLKQPQKILD